MSVRFHCLRNAAHVVKKQHTPLPTIHASTTSFRQLLRLGDRDFAFNVTRWNNDLFVEEDQILSAREWRDDSPSTELLALLDAAEWAEDYLIQNSDLNTYLDGPSAHHEYENGSLLGDDDFFTPSPCVENLPFTNKPSSSKIEAKVVTSKPTMKRSRSVDASDLQIVPYRSSADERTLRAYMDSCHGKLSWRRHRQLFLSGFRLMLAHDLDVLVDERANATILFKPECTLANMDKVDLWLDAMLTGSDQIALIHRDDSATAIRDPQIHFISSHNLRPDENVQKKTMIHSHRLLTFLAQNCAEGKRYRLFRDGSDQLVLLEAEEFGQLELEETCEALANRYDSAFHISIALECLKVSSQLHKAKSDDVACRLLLSAQGALNYAASFGADIQQISEVIDGRLWKYSLWSYQNKKIALTELLAARQSYWETFRPFRELSTVVLDEIDYVHAVHSGISNGFEIKSATPTQAALTVIISTLLRLHSLAVLQDRIKAQTETAECGWIALALGTEILTTYLRLSTVSSTLTHTIQEGASAVTEIQRQAQRWPSLRMLWKTCSDFQFPEQVFDEYDTILERDAILTPMAQAAILHMTNFREKIVRAVWSQWLRTGASLRLEAKSSRSSRSASQSSDATGSAEELERKAQNPLENIAILFESLDSMLTLSRTDDCGELFGPSLLLLGRVYNDIAVQDLFSVDVKQRRENLQRSIGQLLLALHFFRLYFAIVTTRTESRDQDKLGFKFVTEWLCTVSLNLIRAIQLNSNAFRLTSDDHLKGALFEGGCAPGSELSGLFSVGQYETYISAMSMARRLHAFAVNLLLREASSSESESLEAPELPLQTGLSCDQLIPAKISVQPHFKFTLKQLAAVFREREPYISMSMAVDMMQYSPAQRDIVTDTKWKTHAQPAVDQTNSKAKHYEIIQRIDLPKVRKLAAESPSAQYTRDTVRSCFELCDPLLEALWPEFCIDLFPTDDDSVSSCLFMTSFALIDEDNFRLDEARALEHWVKQMGKDFPSQPLDAASQTEADDLVIYSDIPVDTEIQKLTDQVSVEDIPAQELSRWIPSSIIDLADPILTRKALQLPRALKGKKTKSAHIPLMKSRLFPRCDESLKISSVRDLPTLIQNHLLFAAKNFRVDEREAAAAQYHLGVYLANLIMQHDEDAKPSQHAQLQNRLKTKWRTKAVEHLEIARRAFNPAFCLKDYVNVETALYHLLLGERKFAEATALMLAGDLYASDCKNKQPFENVFENAKYLIARAKTNSSPVYIGVIALRNLASRSLLMLLKEPASPADSTILKAVPRAVDILRRLGQMTVDELKELYKLLIKQEPYAQVF